MNKNRGLVVESAEHGNASFNPVSLSLVGRKLDAKDEISGVTSGGKCAGSGEGLVDGAHVNAAGLLDSVHGRYEPNYGHVRVELFGFRLAQLFEFRIPTSAFDVKTPNVTAVCGRCVQSVLMFVYNLNLTINILDRHKLDNKKKKFES